MTGAMPDPAVAAAPMPLSPMFIWTELGRRLDQVHSESSRRIDALGTKLERLDEHGSRGVDQLRDQVGRLADDITGHEKQHAEALKVQRAAAAEQRAAVAAAAAEQRAARRWLVGAVIAVVTPMYPLLIWLISRGRV